jgi:hypothetical protein
MWGPNKTTQTLTLPPLWRFADPNSWTFSVSSAACSAACENRPTGSSTKYRNRIAICSTSLDAADVAAVEVRRYGRMPASGEIVQTPGSTQAHAIPGCQRPVPSQVSSPSCAALHRTSLAIHSMQAPPVQCAGAKHAVPFCHCPFVPHVCGISGLDGLQRGASPGVHAQQSPPVHPSWHGVFAQCPIGSQTCAVLPLHCLAGAVQSLHSFIAQMVQTI